MKFKIKPAWIGLFLIAVMFLSTFAFSILQSFNNPRQKLPTSNIVDYSLEFSLKDALVGSGVTVVTFQYNFGCENCVSQKATLESYANEYKTQIFLEELLDNSLEQSKISMESFYGSEELTNANETAIFQALCKLMVDPPVTCALISS